MSDSEDERTIADVYSKLESLEIKLEYTDRFNKIEESMKHLIELFDGLAGLKLLNEAKNQAEANDTAMTATPAAPTTSSKKSSKKHNALPTPAQNLVPTPSSTTTTIILPGTFDSASASAPVPVPTPTASNEVPTPAATTTTKKPKKTTAKVFFKSIFKEPKDDAVNKLITINNAIKLKKPDAAIKFDVSKFCDYVYDIKNIKDRETYITTTFDTFSDAFRKCIQEYNN